MSARVLVLCVFALTALGFATAAPAQDKSQMQERQAADEALARAIQHSGVVRLGDQATLTLPPGVDFVPAEALNRQVVAYGGPSDDSALGYFKPAAKSGKRWFIEVDFKKSGYIKDDDTKDWDQGKLLKNLQHNYEWLNERNRGFERSEIEAIGWLQRPEYDRAHHRAIWAVDGREKGVPRKANALEQIHGVALGREGFISMDMSTDRDKVATDIPDMLKLLDSLQYNQGKRYEDFSASSDKAAAFGLTRLMGAHASR